MKILKKLKEKKGASTFFELAVLVIVFTMLLAVSVTFLGIYAKHNRVNAIAHEVTRYIEIKGTIDSGAYAEFERQKSAAGLTDAQISFSRTGHIPLEDEFTVTVTVTERFGIGGIKVIPVTVKAVSTGRSEVYWK